MKKAADTIIQLDFSEEMKNSYRDYAMSVIISRALPDIRDGLKPVQRRILYSMSELGLAPDKPHIHKFSPNNRSMANLYQYAICQPCWQHILQASSN